MTTELQALRQQREQLRAAIADLQSQHDAETAQIEAQVAPIAAQADGLAAAFKDSFQAAASAYAAEDGAAAGALAQQGRAQQAQCQALNAQANQLRAQFNRLLPELSGLRGDLRAVNQRIRALTQKPKPKPKPTRATRVPPAGPLGKIQFKGFHRAPEGIDAAFVRRVLREVSTPILEQIDSVAFIDEVQAGGVLGRTAAKPRVSEKARVHLFRHPFDLDDAGLREDYRETILHESGHVLFERLLDTMQRFRWGEMFNNTLRQGGSYISKEARDSKREDFAECARFYMLNPGKLLAEQPERYTVIDEIMERLEQ